MKTEIKNDFFDIEIELGELGEPHCLTLCVEGKPAIRIIVEADILRQHEFGTSEDWLTIITDGLQKKFNNFILAHNTREWNNQTRKLH